MSEAQGQCTNCSGELVAESYCRAVVCRYCQTSNVNPQPLPVGHEVLVRERLACLLGRVTVAHGPDQIEVALENGTSTTRPIEQLIPVTADLSAVGTGSMVYADHDLGWNPSKVVALGAAECTVMNGDRAFRGSFFDQTVPRDRVRVQVGPGAVAKRTSVRWTRFASNPIEGVFKIGFAVAFAIFLGRLVWSFL